MSVGTPTHQGPAIACPHWAPLCLTKARRSFIECCPSRSNSTAARGECAGGVGAPRSAQARRAGLRSRARARTPPRPQPASSDLGLSPGARGRNSSGRSSSRDRRGGGLSPARQKLGGRAVLPHPPHVVTSVASVLPPGRCRGQSAAAGPLGLARFRTHLRSTHTPGPSSQHPAIPWSCPRPSALLLPMRQQWRLAGSPHGWQPVQACRRACAEQRARGPRATEHTGLLTVQSALAHYGETVNLHSLNAIAVKTRAGWSQLAHSLGRWVTR